MEIREMTMEDIEARRAEINAELEAEDADLEALEKEVDELNARASEIKENAEKRNSLIKKVLKRENIVEEKELKKEDKTMDVKELRNSVEYGKAFLKGLKEGDGKFNECRALLSTNGTAGALTGYVPVPEFLENEIKNAWENVEFISHAKITNYKGNVKVGFEFYADGANVHTEGTDAPDEEVLKWGVVELKAESIKKWITVSDDAIEGTTIDTLGEVYKEIAQRIAEKAEEVAIGKIIAADDETTATGCAVPVIEVEELANTTIIDAVAELSGKAKDLYLIMNRKTYASIMAIVLGGNYAIGDDVFAGLKDKIIYTDALDAYADAEAGDTFIIVGDPAYGFQANFPAGNDLKITLDNLSLAEKDLVKIVGRQYVGMDVVAPNAFVKINKKGATTETETETE